jgi:glutamine synthetase type III
VTHYTTGSADDRITAEKHEPFITRLVAEEGHHGVRGKELVQGEPDASSFPSGDSAHV